jgi:hypothetical protein
MTMRCARFSSVIRNELQRLVCGNHEHKGETTLTARDTFNSSVTSNHGSAEFGGITFNTGATVAPPGNATTWSRSTARAALGSGAITHAQFVAVMGAISNWEENQNGLAKSTLRGTLDTAPC